ncbi:helix-turn-helix transcriptional regulator [Thalassotalea castellviae]|uniref:AlpA family phage regulatory protein n=1 Tax=Thalassotalea castellviae TaxID=3075612 RepID=A0ABU2ZX86_9GAMM|nr:AlpA family phage regulatory protein [Thalassotalea sp. W431]MDT0602544.1 AlpA family phage regulatory protein [Thalassotalea sp. W431]
MKINEQLDSLKKILRLSEVKQITGLSRSTIYEKCDVKSPRFDPLFPKRIRLGARAVGFLQADLDAWLCSMIELSSANKGEE